MKNLNHLKTVSILTIISGVLFLCSCSKKKGCTDSNAINYDPSAQTSDPGACNYTVTTRPNEVNVTDNGSGVGTKTWSKDSIYVLDGFVYVNSGQTLTIEAGTIIEGKPGSGANASALIVTRGGTIMAEGSKTEPIIFTYYNDKRGTSTPLSRRGLWGGVIILGNAGLNTIPSTKSIEGIPTTETRGMYGGTDDRDNSGVFKWVSIRHGGTNIGANNEINGLTLGGVGSETTIEHVEVVANLDDGFEFFGGTVNTKYLVSAYCGDDGFDYDEGFRGKGQFWLTILSEDSDRGGEHDGGTNPEDGTPYATPTIYNATFIGNGTSRAITFRDNAGGNYINSVFHDFGKGLDIEDLAGASEDSRKRLDAGELSFKSNTLSKIKADTITYSGTTTGAIGSNSNISSIEYITLSITASNPVPATGGAGLTGDSPAPTSDPFFTSNTYKGAFEPGGNNWADGWTRTFEK